MYKYEGAEVQLHGEPIQEQNGCLKCSSVHLSDGSELDIARQKMDAPE